MFSCSGLRRSTRSNVQCDLIIQVVTNKRLPPSPAAHKFLSQNEDIEKVRLIVCGNEISFVTWSGKRRRELSVNAPE